MTGLSLVMTMSKVCNVVALYSPKKIKTIYLRDLWRAPDGIDAVEMRESKYTIAIILKLNLTVC